MIVNRQEPDWQKHIQLALGLTSYRSQ
jgi:hypothetical protein